MKIIVIGGEGTIGKIVAQHYKVNHEVIIASRSTVDFPVDIADTNSISALYKKTGPVNAIVCAAGEAKWAPFNQLSESDYDFGLKSKLMGQVNVVRHGLNFLLPGGSITLTSGILADDPVYQTASAAMVNGALHSFVKAVSLELTKGHRLNIVSSGVVEDAYEKYKNYFPGHPSIPMNKMLLGYIRSIEGRGNGEIIRIYS